MLLKNDKFMYCNLFLLHLLLLIVEMNTTSFQTNHYNHLQQTQIHGQSGLKILAGEDLSIFNNYVQPTEIESDSNKCSQMLGGDSKCKKKKEKIITKRQRKTHSMNKHCKSMNIGDFLNNKKLRD